MSSNQDAWPRISIVTPNFNCAGFVGKTIESVTESRYPGLQYVVVDGASSDGSQAVIERYRDRLAHVISEPDKGHSDAINKGFALTDGEIMGWINSDDIYLPGCLYAIAKIFRARPDVEWITGRPTVINEAGALVRTYPLRKFSRLRFMCGHYQYVQQESTFWRRSLWERAGGRLDTSVHLANDLELWTRFFRHAELHPFDHILASFRRREGQRSIAFKAEYEAEAVGILEREFAALDEPFRSKYRAILPPAFQTLTPAQVAAADSEIAAADPPVITFSDFATIQREHANVPAPAIQREGSPDSLIHFKNTHLGQRCFIMGNGPSLKKMDLVKLKDEVVFGCNSIFLLFDKIPWRPTYYTCVDSRVLPDRASDIDAVLRAHPEITAFFPAMLQEHSGLRRRFFTREIIAPGANRYYFNERQNSLANLPGSMFSTDIDDVVIQPYTVAITMLQIAAYMGFSEIYLIGCDTTYVIPDSVKKEGLTAKGKIGLALTSTKDDDPNHFDPRYFGKDRQWHDPQTDMMIEHYKHARRSLDALGLNVFNATVGGALEVFPRADFDSLLQHRDPARDGRAKAVALSSARARLAAGSPTAAEPRATKLAPASSPIDLQDSQTIVVQSNPIRSTSDATIAPLPAADDSLVSPPLLSIVIPAYDRPTTLLHALEIFTRQVSGTLEREVEIIVTDDASPGDSLAPVASFAARHSFIKFRRREKNIGLERSLIAAAEGARGEFLWIFGDDDYLEHSDTLAEIVRHLRADQHDILVLNRTRRNSDLSQLLSPNWMRLGPDDQEFPGLREFCLKYGFISVIGFISVNIFRRDAFVKVDPSPYYGTMYPQLGMMLEAFHDRPVRLMARPNVCHRTQSQEEKRASLGTKTSEAEFMTDAERRNALYFSHPYIQMLDRLVTLGALRREDIVRIPENTVIVGPLDRFLIDCLKRSVSYGHAFSDGQWKRSLSFMSSLPLSEPHRQEVTELSRARFGKELGDLVVGDVAKRNAPGPGGDVRTISVVTPSFNQAEFLDECLASVANQSLAPLEHLVYDPGSTDGSREIARKYGHLTLFPERDDGQSDAINKGYRRAKGDVIIWLNSDDAFADNRVFERVMRRFNAPDRPDIVYGKGIYIDEKGGRLRDVYLNKRPETLPWRLQQEDGILQPALFMRRSVFETIGELNGGLHYCMDYEYWIRCVKAGVKFAYMDDDLALARYHSSNKTYGQRGKSYAEVCDMLVNHFGYANHNWLRRYAEFLSDGFDGVLAHAANTKAKDEAEIDSRYIELMKTYNTDQHVWRLLEAKQSERGFGDTWRELQRLKLGTAEPLAVSLFEKPRSTGANVDESQVVARLLAERRGGSHVLLDVGAHFGTVTQYFHQLGWTIHCFEPDAANRAKLQARFGKAANVTIDPRAVSDKPATGVSFYTSEESTGISGLQAFRKTHKASALVDVTTIDEIARDRGIKHVDFLKIDVEGFDFSVLKGVPWDRLRPDVIECEFEDAKTEGMGHTYRDVCDFLQAKGYAVYISEWHPIVRYGIRHDWRRVVRYPSALAAADAWGNILAFQSDPGLEAVQSAFVQCLRYADAPSKVVAEIVPAVKSQSVPRLTVVPTAAPAAETSAPSAQPRPQPEAAKPAAIAPHEQVTVPRPVQVPTTMMSSRNSPYTERLPLYTRFALWAQARSPLLFRLGQFVMWCLRVLRRHALPATAGVLVLVGLAAAGLYAPVAQAKLAFWFAAGAAAVAAGVVVLMGYIGHLIKRSRDSLQQMQAMSQSRLGAEISEHSRRIETLRSELAKLGSQASAMSTQLQTVQTASTQGLAELRSGLNSGREQHAATVRQLADVDQAVRTNQQHVTTLRGELTAASAQGLAELRSSLNSDREQHAATVRQLADVDQAVRTNQQNVTTLRDELTAAREQLQAVRQELDATKAALAENQAQLAALRDERSASVSQLKDASTRIAAASKAAQDVAQEVARFSSKISDVERPLAGRIGQLEARAQQLESQLFEVIESAEGVAQRAQSAVDLGKRLEQVVIEGGNPSMRRVHQDLSTEDVEKISIGGALKASQMALDTARVTGEKLADIERKLGELVAASSGSTSSIRNKVDQLSNQVAGAADLASTAMSLIENLDKAQNNPGGGAFRRFNRTLSAEQVAMLGKNWTQKLATPVAPATFMYMAHRAATIESLLRGRMATSIEDVMLRTLVAMSTKRESVSILEIGTLFGTGAAIIYDAVRPLFEDVHVTLIDPLDGYYSSGRNDILTGQPVTEPIVRANLEKVGLTGGDLTIIKKFSTDEAAIAAAAERRYDVLVIDGDHTYSGVKADFENYGPFVRLGGHIVFDDYGSDDWPDVKAYVDREVAGRSELALIGHEWRTMVFRVVRRGAVASSPRVDGDDGTK